MVIKNIKYGLDNYIIQIIAAVSCTLGSLSDGMHYGWQSPSLPKLQQPDSPIQLTEEHLIWLDGVYFFGGLIAIPVVTYTADKIGRKWTILSSSILSVVAWMIFVFMSSATELFVGRGLAGFASVAFFTAGPIYIGEMADKRIRGCLGGLVFFNFIIGVFVIYAVGPYLTVRRTAFIGLCVPLLQCITFVCIPETPYYRLLKSDKEAAETSLRVFRRRQDVAEELAEIQDCVQRQQNEPGRIQDLFTIASNRKAVIIVCTLYTAQNFSAMTVLFMSIHTILDDAKGMFDVSIAAIIFSLVMICAGFVSSLVLDKYGRKRLIYFSCSITGVSLGVISMYFFLKVYHVDINEIRWLPAFALILYAAGFMSGFGNIPVVLAGELFPTSVKSQGVSFCNSIYLIVGVLSMYFHRFVTKAFGLHISFLLYSFFCFMTIVFTYFYIPETTGKTLDEVHILLKGKSK